MNYINEIKEQVLANSFLGTHKSKIICSAGLYMTRVGSSASHWLHSTHISRKKSEALMTEYGGIGS